MGWVLRSGSHWYEYWGKQNAQGGIGVAGERVSGFLQAEGRLTDEIAIEEALRIRDRGQAEEVIVASIRHPLHVVEAALIGADIATLPFASLEKLVKHPLTDIGIERFLSDWKKVQKR